ALRTELVDDVADALRDPTDPGRVRHPHVALAVDVDAVRPRDQTRTEARQQTTVEVEPEHGRHVVAPDTAVLTAPLRDPDRAAVRRRIDCARRTPGAARRQLAERL